jgi:hypothetical protein
MVGYKGASYNFNPDLIIITSNEPPCDWYYGEKHGLFDALRRRIDVCLKFLMVVDNDGNYILNEERTLMYIEVEDRENMKGADEEHHDSLHRLNKMNSFISPPVDRVVDFSIIHAPQNISEQVTTLEEMEIDEQKAHQDSQSEEYASFDDDPFIMDDDLPPFFDEQYDSQSDFYNLVVEEDIDPLV